MRCLTSFARSPQNCVSKVETDGQECPPYTVSLPNVHNFAVRSRRALVMTETELKLMAAAAKMGLSRMPKNG